MNQSTRTRSMIKTLIWRVLATTDTFVLGWLVTGSPSAAGGIAGLEVLTKMVLYYMHERAWSKVDR